MYPHEPLHRLPYAVQTTLGSLLRASTLIHIAEHEGGQPGRQLLLERESARRTLALLATARPALKATLPLLADLAQCVAERTALALMLDGNYQAAQRQREEMLQAIVAAGEVAPGLAAELNSWAAAVGTAACAAAGAGGARFFRPAALAKLRSTLERKQARVFEPRLARADAKRFRASAAVAGESGDLLQSLLH